MFDGLAKNGKIDDLNRLYREMRRTAVRDRVEWRSVDQLIVYSANLKNLENLDDETALKTLEFILEDVASPSSTLHISDNIKLIGSRRVHTKRTIPDCC